MANDVFLVLAKDNWFYLVLVALISYLIGSLSFSIISTKIRDGKDVRSMGSGNAGFTNVLRSSGKLPAVATFIGDFTKGVLAVWIGVLIVQTRTDFSSNVEYVKYCAYLAGFMCLIGHVYPCFFGFKGGKGVLTAWSTTLLIDWRVFIIIISVFLIVLYFSKIVSLSSISAAASYPITTFFITLTDYFKGIGNIYYVAACSLTALAAATLVICKHRSNISRLVAGTEKKIESKK